MNVSVKLQVTVGDGADKRVFVVESHAVAAPVHPYDAGWMALAPDDMTASAAVQRLAIELASHATDLVLAAEAGAAPRWGGGGGAPETVIE